MKIVHKVDKFLNALFPGIDLGDENKVTQKLKDFYSFGPFKPQVKVENGFITIDIDVPKIASEGPIFKKVVNLCEQGKFNLAKPLLSDLIKSNPTNSEYHRIMGQILSEEGNHEDATDSLIDSLRWDSTNAWALIMMGNIFAKYKNDLSTAKVYYDQAVIANPKDNIAVNNIGANLLQQGKLEEAKDYFYEAMKIDPKYPNTHYALGMIAENEEDLPSAFFSYSEALKLSKRTDPIQNTSFQQLIAVARKLTDSPAGDQIVNQYIEELTKSGKKRIEIIPDEEIPTAAKMDFAENYGRDSHRVIFKPSYPYVSHLIAHELVHLDFVIQARQSGANQLFISTEEHKGAFIKNIASIIQSLKKKGLSERSLNGYASELFEGMNRQMFNTPIDLFIEDFLHSKFPDLRPYQLLSLLQLNQEGLNAVTDKKAVELSPPTILSKSKILNLVNALLLKQLYGVDLTNNFKATPQELKMSRSFFDEYLEYKDNKEPAEEYELVQNWAKDLKLDAFFELVDEIEFRSKRNDVDSLLESIENDPYDLESNDPYKKQEMDQFISSQKAIGLNMAIVYHMVDAFNYFKNMPQSKVREIAYDIALTGTQGYRPDGQNYTVSTMPGKKFTGYHILAYYYISWMISEPTMVSKLQLPYEEEFKIAQGFIQRQGYGKH